MAKLTKKEIKAIESEISIIKANIETSLLRAMGYDLSPTGDVMDQETFMPVTINHRILKYSPDNDIVSHRGAIRFDPTNDYKLAISLFGIYLEKEFRENGLYCKLYYPISYADNTAIEAIIEQNQVQSKICSLYYHNQLFAYLNIIFMLNGIDMNQLLTRLDELKYALQQ